MASPLPRGRRIVILCEGDTEELAVNYFVRRQWRDEGLQGVGLKPVNLYGKLEEAGRFAADYLDDGEVLSVFALIDLLRMNRVKHQANDPLDAKVERVRSWLRSQVHHHRRAQDFFPHVSVHEVEAGYWQRGRPFRRGCKTRALDPIPRQNGRISRSLPKSESVNSSGEIKRQGTGRRLMVSRCFRICLSSRFTTPAHISASSTTT